MLIDWGRARIGSPLEDVSSWLQSLGYWEPRARRKHDPVLVHDLAYRGVEGGLSEALRTAYWVAGASNALAGALEHHVIQLSGRMIRASGTELLPPRGSRSVWCVEPTPAGHVRSRRILVRDSIRAEERVVRADGIATSTASARAIRSIDPASARPRAHAPRRARPRAHARSSSSTTRRGARRHDRPPPRPGSRRAPRRAPVRRRRSAPRETSSSLRCVIGMVGYTGDGCPNTTKRRDNKAA